MKPFFIVFFSFVFSFSAVYGQTIPTAWDELTASDFVLAVKKSEGVCLIPIGVIEKHGQHLPLGTDVFAVREICCRAAAKEYCIVFPPYYAAQINEAKQQPGTIAYSPELMNRLLEETCQEISRNGIKKIIIVNGHGGNNTWLSYFCLTQLASPRDFVVYYTNPPMSEDAQKKIAALRKSTTGGHADEGETSNMLVIRPDLVKMERATSESGQNLNRLQQLPSELYTGIRWYAQYPNHYAGDAKDANTTMGEISIENRVENMVNLIKAVKADQTTLRLQNDFFKDSETPLDTKAKP